MSITLTNHRLWVAVVALLAAVVFFPQRAQAAAVTIDLCAKPGSITMPGGATVTIWGYALGNCTTAPAPTVPGPTLSVNQGDVVTVNLYNGLLVQSTLLFQGQTLIPDLVGVASNSTKSYVFTATNPGTYLYEAGLVPGTQYQVGMGLYGALIVRPATPNQAYLSATTVYTDEAVVVLSEIDPVLNNSPTPAGFDLRNYKPTYWLVNGQAYPNSVNIATVAGNRVLLRYINAGLQPHSMSILGLNQTVIAVDGSFLSNAHTIVAETIAPGQTLDAITTIPSTAAAGSKFALYDGNLILHNNNAAGFGGMLTFLALPTGTPGPDTTGPTTSNMALSPNPTNGTTNVALSATVSDAATGNAAVTAAEYFIDTIGINGAGTAMGGTFTGPTVNVNATLAPALLATLAGGNHTIYVHGRDSLNNWGAVNALVLNLDKGGPTTNGLALSANPSNGTVNVVLSGSANDSASGNSNITAAEYFIGTTGTNGSGIALSLNTTSAPIASLSATIAATTVNALAQGSYTISVHSRDAFNNWGAFATIALKVDKIGPTTSAVAATPNVTNRVQGSSPTEPALRVNATFNDTVVAAASVEATDTTNVAVTGVADGAAVHLYMPLVISNQATTNVDAAAIIPGTSYVKGGEGFIDTVGAPGTGFLFTPSDGLFDSGSEQAYTLIPLTTILQLTDGTHTIYVRGQDSAGNWGATSSNTILVDKTAPTFSSITLTPNAFNVGTVASVTLTINGAADTGGAGVVGGEYWFGTTDPAPGGGTLFTGAATNIPVATLAPGIYTVRARIRDAAGNWSSGVNGIRSATLTVRPVLYFSTVGNSNPPGVAGTADDADIYFWDGTAFSRAIDVTALSNPLPSGANVDGFDRLNATQYYMSFSGSVTVPGISGTVQDEDIVFRNGTTWSLYFDGSVNGLASANFDLDAISIVGAGGAGNIYFSTDNNNVPNGAGGAGDDADIYRWNGGTSYTRVVDVSAITNPLPAGANVDGLIWVDATHFYLSFAGNVALPGLATVQDEDVVYYNAGVWSVYFDGTAAGLTSDNLDLDAFDLP